MHLGEVSLIFTLLVNLSMPFLHMCDGLEVLIMLAYIVKKRGGHN